MDEHRYREAGTFSRSSYQLLANNIENAEIKLVVEHLIENLNRIASLHFLPPLTIFLSGSVRWWMDRAMFELTGKLDDSSLNDKEVFEKIVTRYGDSMRAWLKNFGGDSNALANEVFRKGNDQFELLCANPDPKLSPELLIPGKEAILFAMLMNTWTAFEAFATDLWVAAINSSPKRAAYASKTSPRGKRSEADTDFDVDNKSGKSVDIETIEKFGWNLTDKMGSVMKDSRKFNFNRLGGIENAYVAAFGGDAKKIFDDPKHSRLTVLEGIRNVIAHSAGRVDPVFKSRASSNSAAYKTLADVPLRTIIPVDGIMVREFIDLCISICSHLLALAQSAVIEKNEADEPRQNPQPS